jgi:1-acyl-sn-glycerol-3-phosphate acyltransferase
MRRARAALRIARFLGIACEAVGTARLARDQRIPARARRLHDACAGIATTHGLALSLRGALPDGPFVMVANHASYLDAIAIAAVLPCAPIAKSEVAAWPVIGGAAAGLGAIFVERRAMSGRVRALRRALTVLRAGVPVLNFPEGTTTDGTRLLPFHRGIFGVARIAGVPIIPVAIRCARALAWHGNAPFLPHYLRTTMIDPELELVIGKPMIADRSADELALIAHHRIAHALRDQLESHATVIRLRVPPPRPDAVLSPPEHSVAR